MNSNIDICRGYQAASFTERLYLFCEYRDLRKIFLEIERTDQESAAQILSKQNRFQNFFSVLLNNILNLSKRRSDGRCI
jgi:hypothetical protein